MTPTEAIAKLEADFAPRDQRQTDVNECLVSGPVFDALIAVAKAAQSVSTSMLISSGPPEYLVTEEQRLALEDALAALGEAVSE